MVFTSYTIEWYNFFQSSMSCFFILLITQFILDLMLYNSFTFLLFLFFTKSFIAVWLRSTRAANKRSNNAVASATCFTLRAMEKVNGASRSIAAVEHGLPRGGPVDTIRVGCAHSWGFVEFIGCTPRKTELVDSFHAHFRVPLFHLAFCHLRPMVPPAPAAKHALDDAK